MPGSRKDDAQREWVQARVDEAGQIDRAKPADFTQSAWRQLCRRLEVKAPRYQKVRTLDEALKRVADLAT